MLGASSEADYEPISSGSGTAVVYDLSGLSFSPQIKVEGDTDEDALIRKLRDLEPEFIDFILEALSRREGGAMSQQTVGFIDYVAQGGDTFDSIALVAYNEERMASTIIEANPDLSDVLIFEGGEAVRIPIVEIVETPETLPPWRR